MGGEETKNSTVHVEFSGLPIASQKCEVLFESPRFEMVKDGRFTDSFAPHEVHVYRFRK